MGGVEWFLWVKQRGFKVSLRVNYRGFKRVGAAARFSVGEHTGKTY